ncbi:hypothetical protein XA68_11492 [Ophiocordyceps unilateralis]|uniref:Protein kinase domain-containing protein n=1 Tax=Ophiocordyceps unilateralis TaxID=268505 RepID=A0A2A9PFS9_OPHUN|nr:hypothetical protein XA68_11492 [Ophiocordyceps unilateralis]
MALDLQLGAAGLGLSAFSTALDLLSSCSRMYDLWKTAEGLDTQLETLRALLLLQQALLEQWQRDWLDVSISGPQAIQRRRLLKQHGSTVEHTLKAVQRLLGKLEPLRETACGNLKRDLSAMERLQWVTREISSSQKVLAEVEVLLSSLYRLFPVCMPNPDASAAIVALDYIPDVVGTSSADTTLNKTINLRQLRHGLDQDLEQRVAGFLQSMPRTDLDLAPSQVEITDDDSTTAGLRSFGILDKAGKVMVEWKKYDSSWRGQRGIRMRGRIRNIAQFLHADSKPDELLTPRCVGVFDDTERSRYGFVFCLPLDADAKILSLKQLLDNRTPETLPSLEDRFRVAYQVGLSLAILHTAGWLHKSIRSQNILFSVRGGRPVWSRPYLTGFDFSRPDAVDESSEKPDQSARFNLYRHPSAQGGPGENYRKAFDVYSFGVLLVEIGLWRSAWKLWADGMTAMAFRDSLVGKSNDWLAHSMGHLFQDATLKCLTGELETRKGPMQRVFCVEVVEALGRLIVDV